MTTKNVQIKSIAVPTSNAGDMIPGMIGTRGEAYEEDLYYCGDMIESHSETGMIRTTPSYRYFFGKTMFVGACNTGQNELLVQHIADETGSLVIASQHKLLAGYEYDGSNYLNYGPLMDPKSYQYTKSDGVSTSTITNFTIDKNLGTNWDGKQFFK